MMSHRMFHLRKPWSFWLLACAVAWASMGTPKAHAKKKKLRVYIVQPGESCWSIALKLYGNGRKYRIIHRYNKLGKEPHILRPGQKLYLPGVGSQADAKIEWLRRKVLARPPRSVSWREAKRQMNLWRLYKVQTNRQSSAGIRFDDSSYLKMNERALLVIYGSSAQRVQTRKLVKRKILVERGVVRGGLGSLGGKSKMTLRTPSGEVELQSKLAQVEVDKAKTAIVSVYDGHANVKAKGKKVKVPKDYGTYVKKGKAPAKPMPLPPPPVWENSQKEAVIVVPKQQLGKMTFRWKPVKRARRYRFEISRTKSFKIALARRTYPKPKKFVPLPGSPVLRAVIGKGVQGFRYVGMKLGTYYARVSAIDRNKLEGHFSKILRIRVVEMQASKSLQPAQGGFFEATGLLRISPDTKKGPVEYSLNGSTFEAFTEPIRLMKPGSYILRFRPKGETPVSSEIKLRLLPVDARLVGPKAKLVPKGKDAALSLTLSSIFRPVVFKRADGNDSSPKMVRRGVALPGLKLTAYPGGELPVKATEAGQFVATLKAPEAYPGGDITVVASWLGGELARVTVPVKKPRVAKAPPPRIRKIVKYLPPAPIFSWQTTAVGMEWANAGPAMPSRAARPITALQLRSFFQEHTRLVDPLSSQVEQALFLRISFAGSLALLNGKVGVDFELPWMKLDVARDSIDQNKLGDIRVGGRAVIFETERLLVAPSLRLSLPTGGHRRSYRGTAIEPGLLLTWRPLDWLSLHTNQMFVIDADFASHFGLFYTSAYGVEARYWRFSFALEMTMLLGGVLQQPAGLQGIGLSGAIRLEFDRARIGLVVGGMLDEAGRTNLGGFSAGLTFALGFRGP